MKRACGELLDAFRREVEAHEDKYFQYERELAAWQEAHEAEAARLQQAEAHERAQRAALDGSQLVEWQGEPYDCAHNTSALQCTTFASQAHEKCKCQALYGGRPHLHAPCAASGGLLSAPLTRDYCAARGFLDNHDLHRRLVLSPASSSAGTNPTGHSKHRGQQQSPSAATAGVAAPPTFAPAATSPAARTTEVRELPAKPVPPVLRFPTVTCAPCADEFRALELDFTHENLARCADCIAALDTQRSRRPPPPSPSTTRRTAPKRDRRAAQPAPDPPATDPTLPPFPAPLPSATPTVSSMPVPMPVPVAITVTHTNAPTSGPADDDNDDEHTAARAGAAPPTAMASGPRSTLWAVGVALLAAVIVACLVMAVVSWTRGPSAAPPHYERYVAESCTTPPPEVVVCQLRQPFHPS